MKEIILKYIDINDCSWRRYRIIISPPLTTEWVTLWIMETVEVMRHSRDHKIESDLDDFIDLVGFFCAPFFSLTRSGNCLQWLPEDNPVAPPAIPEFTSPPLGELKARVANALKDVLNGWLTDLPELRTDGRLPEHRQVGKGMADEEADLFVNLLHVFNGREWGFRHRDFYQDQFIYWIHPSDCINLRINNFN